MKFAGTEIDQELEAGFAPVGLKFLLKVAEENAGIVGHRDEFRRKSQFLETDKSLPLPRNQSPCL